MPGGKTYKLEQVSVRLKLMEEAPLYSTEKIDSPEKAIEVMRDMMKNLDRENVCVVNLDGASHPINFNVVSIGSINSSELAMRELFKTAILSNTSNILLLHNHPSSSITPSKNDHAVTARVMMAAQMMGIPLVDHIIVAGGTGEYFSYKKELKGFFGIDGVKALLRANGIEGVFAEPVVQYRTEETDIISGFGSKRLGEKEEGKGGGDGKEVIEAFRAETDRYFKEISGMNARNIEAFVIAEAQRIFDDYDMDIRIVDAVVSGSRSRGLEKENSDIDVVLEYEGDEPEDAVFGVLNEEKLVLGDVRVDINPITSWKSGTLEEYLPQAEEHLKQAQKETQEYKPLTKVEEMEEENYNQIDNYLSNTKPKSEEIRERRQEDADRIKRLPGKDRPSILTRMREKKAVVEARNTAIGATERKPNEERVV